MIFFFHFQIKVRRKSVASRKKDVLMEAGEFQSCHTMKDPLVDPRKCWASLKSNPTTAFFTQHFRELQETFLLD